ncbi:hypothetical protein YPPY98_1378, partial [Yersinia pestis PY-98]
MASSLLSAQYWRL